MSETSNVSRAAAIIHNETKRDIRARTAIQLTQWVRRNASQVTDAAISILIDLLRDDDDIVRGEAAGSLGFIGPRAIAAAPALARALRERPCTTQPGQSADAMRIALVRIGADPIDIPCADPLFADASTSIGRKVSIRGLVHFRAEDRAIYPAAPAADALDGNACFPILVESSDEKMAARMRAVDGKVVLLSGKIVSLVEPGFDSVGTCRDYGLAVQSVDGK